MSKSIENYFTDWESYTFGYGYGTGEYYTVRALMDFLSLCNNETGGYDYQALEKAMSGVAVWLLINILCGARIIEFGTSPRYGWLTPEGRALKTFINSRTADELYELTSVNQDYTHCFPDHCNCFEEKCSNPFWEAA